MWSVQSEKTCGLFGNRKRAERWAASLEGPVFVQSLKGEARLAALRSFRTTVFLRDRLSCVKCGRPVTWESGELHEKVHRSQGGERTLENCETLCHDCHTGRKGVHGFGDIRRRISKE
jgi:hypothetical protein